jgi:hypothetical protein
MRIAALTITYTDEPLIEGCIRSMNGLADKHLFMVSNTPFYGHQYGLKPDKTVERIEYFGGEVIEGSWVKGQEAQMRNEGVEALKSYDWIVTTDTDMWLTKKNHGEIRDALIKAEHETYVAPQLAYWHDTEHILVGDDFKPVIAIRPSVRFEHIGSVHGQPGTMKTMIHHLNWCAPKDVLKKVLTYAHAPEFKNAKDWYENHFVGWQEGNPAIMPDGKFFDVKYDPLPEELRSWL